MREEGAEGEAAVSHQIMATGTPLCNMHVVRPRTWRRGNVVAPAHAPGEGWRLQRCGVEECRVLEEVVLVQQLATRSIPGTQNAIDARAHRTLSHDLR